MPDYRVIYIFGTDGSGKSTVARELVGMLRQKGIEAGYRWMRFNHYLSKVVNALGRLWGLSFYSFYPDGTKVGYHHYYKSRLISAAYCLTTIIDTFFSTVFKLRIPMAASQKIIVLDRFVFDTMIDLSVDTKNPDLPSRWQGKLLRKLLPSQTVAVYLDVDKDVIFSRRPDTRWDDNFAMKHALYREMNKKYDIGYKVNNNGEISAALKNITTILERYEKERSSAAV